MKQYYAQNSLKMQNKYLFSFFLVWCSNLQGGEKVPPIGLISQLFPKIKFEGSSNDDDNDDNDDNGDNDDSPPGIGLFSSSPSSPPSLLLHLHTQEQLQSA